MPGTAANGTIVSAGPAVWAVERVVPASDRTLRLEFRDGRRGVFDFRPYLDFGPYAPLRDVELFMKAHVAYDTSAWPDDIDIAPERLYSDCTPSVGAAKQGVVSELLFPGLRTDAPLKREADRIAADPDAGPI